ncbi:MULTISPECIES: Trp biosynthesis-associated membrane protein [unclassified Isoptericola]|uniref:Trp biosynthesis-associated membrane protein n=1 Tax=unclassified Isoptericola TaxID=2623355 RepID=UPI002713D50E|nr:MULTISPECIES: Trp biosynthesis-associated membrane protein [unclassified Isoptericola]MDO8144980.1 Trp biosynthesis-associated membrane protein [Isoptericola sp. 178]MDO8148613.1 Trp biosynthesis-associated membrane protein [Isoptericola sp. b515]MDO8151441.1 Trp biosynthesis-associated membrane protein [Isoptericola sp. b408]
MIRSRGRAVALLLLLGAATFGVSAPVWLRTTVATALQPEVTVEVAGTSAAPVVSAAAFVTVACALATTLAGRVARRVALVVAVLAGLAVVGGTAAVLRDPVGPAVTAAADAAGVTELTAPVSLTPWPWLAVVAGAGIAVVAVLGLVGAGSWPATGGRHERAGGPVATAGGEEPRTDDDAADAQADWDALSRGTDPSSDR